MEKTVCFRDFEERDIDFIYKCKNDAQLNRFIVGEWHPFSYEEATRWVHGCMGEHETYKFWAVCTNDEEQRIIGWVSIARIDLLNRCASFHGIVIGDPNYRNGSAWIESYIFIFEYVFRILKLHRLNDSFLSVHPVSGIIADAMFMMREGVMRQAHVFEGNYVDIVCVGILSAEYFAHLGRGEYAHSQILRRMLNNIKVAKHSAK